MDHSAPIATRYLFISSCVIFGHRSLQNLLLAQLIEKHLGIPCAITANIETNLSTLQPGALALLDAGASSAQTLEAEVLAIHEPVSVIAIFNAPANQALDRLLRYSKVRGLFYENTMEEQFLKGIKFLSLNEYWLPRKVLAEYLDGTRRIDQRPTTAMANLTAKETLILSAMISGAKNSDIAQVLHVSPHTIKTHVYNLFRKIKVNNRVQAVSWALVNTERAQ